MERTKKVALRSYPPLPKSGQNAEPGSEQFSKESGDLGHRTPDELLPVKNMADWGCDGNFIKEPRYAERAYKLCSPVDGQPYQKITGQIVNADDPPSMLQKQKHKKPFFTTPMSRSTPRYRHKEMQDGRTERPCKF